MNQVKKIYIVEDESIVALDISNQIKTIGYKVVGISSHSQDCLIQIQQKQPDLILMDVRLNGQFSGVNVASEIYETLKIPIVFLTSYSDKQTLNEIQQIGNYGYVKKPFNILELKTEIEFTHNRFNKHLALKEESERSKITLKEKEEFFEQIVNNVSDIIYQIDLKGNFTYLNSSALSQTNFSKEELIGKHYSLLVRLDYKDKVYHFFRSIYEQKTEKVYMEFPILTKNRVEIWLGQNVHLLKKESQIIGFQVVARDITQEKEFKEQLIMAKMHAEHTARIKSQFLANMSHEIRTPLYGIVGVVTLLEKTNLSEKQTKYIQAINASSNQLMGIINDVLDLSKIDAGKMDIVDADIELYELIQSVISVFELKSENQHVSLTYTIDSTVPHFVVGDAVRLNQVLYNLIGNAIKFTEKGIVHVDISLLEETHEKHLIQFTVTDSGVGMAPEDCDKIFDAFTQIESESSLNKQGTGLGLTIVKKLIEMLNGSISVESILNEGSSFIIRLPFKRAYATNYTTKEYAIQYEKPTNVCILLVEDNPINQLVTKDLLENEGAVVSIAENGLVALDKIDSEQVDLVIMDMQMPVLNGHQTLKIIRNSSDEHTKSLPVIALSANVVRSEIEKCYISGADDYLSKPFKPEILFKKVSDLLVKKRSEHDLSGFTNERVNLNTLESYTNGKPELLFSTIAQLKESFLGDTITLQESFQSEDEKTMKLLAHKLKPSFIMLGMVNHGELCKQIEYALNPKELKQKTSLLLHFIPVVIDELELLSAANV